MSLISLAEQDNLPDFQFLDEDTLCWIIANRPKFVVSKYDQDFVKFSINKVQKFLPLQEWFLENKGIDSIHGMRHILRVVANTAYLVREKNIIDERVIIAVFIAASLHDLRRKNDRGDEGHANRAVKWFLLNKNSILNHYQIDITNVNIDAISAAISFHEQKYEQIIDNPDYKKNKIVVDLLKSGDALDRYRLPKLKWWINDAYLSMVPSEEVKLFAYTLVLESERIFLGEGNSIPAVLKSFDKLK